MSDNDQASAAIDWHEVALRSFGHIDALMLYVTHMDDSHPREAMAFALQLREALGIRREPRMAGQIKPAASPFPLPLAAPAADEPVAWMYEHPDFITQLRLADERIDREGEWKLAWTETPLYAHPPAAEPVGLREAEIDADLAAIGPRPVGMVLAWKEPRPCFYRNTDIKECGHCHGCRERIARESALATPARTDDAALHERIMQEMWASEDEDVPLYQSRRLGTFQRLAHAAVLAPMKEGE